MKEKIQGKINAHIASILKKDAIDFCDYQILCNELARLKAIEKAEKMKSKSGEFNDLMAKSLQMLSSAND